MRQIDELHLEHPFAGSRLLRDMLAQRGIQVGRKHVRSLMRRMAIEALYRKPNTSKPAPGHRIYPYLLRGVSITRPNQVWAMDISYIPMARGFVYLAAVIDWFSRRVLSWKLSITMDVSFCLEALDEALARYGKPNATTISIGERKANILCLLKQGDATGESVIGARPNLSLDYREIQREGRGAALRY
jgi:putative transposase